jgi:hypothetical protein
MAREQKREKHKRPASVEGSKDLPLDSNSYRLYNLLRMPLWGANL